MSPIPQASLTAALKILDLRRRLHPSILYKVFDPFEDLVPQSSTRRRISHLLVRLYKLNLLSKIPTHSRFLDKILMPYPISIPLQG